MENPKFKKNQARSRRIAILITALFHIGLFAGIMTYSDSDGEGFLGKAKAKVMQLIDGDAEEKAVVVNDKSA